MKETTKGLFAAIAAAAILLGGAGSLAYWSATGTVGGGAINSGKLTLTGQDCGTGWTLDSGELVNGAPFVPGTTKLVPGDVISKTCTYTVNAVGEHLRATLAASGGTKSGALAPYVTVSSSFTVDGSPATEITEANDADVLSATISVTFNTASDNTSQDLAGALSDYVVTLTQAHN